MESKSARMSSAAEAKFRINAPNSRPRAVKVIALDAPSERVVKEAGANSWQGATFLTAFAGAAAGGTAERFSLGGWLNDLAGRTKNLVEEIAAADLVVMVASAGENAAAAIVGEACRPPACNDHRAHPRHRIERRGAVENAGAIAATRDDARDFQRGRIY